MTTLDCNLCNANTILKNYYKEKAVDSVKLIESIMNKLSTNDETQKICTLIIDYYKKQINLKDTDNNLFIVIKDFLNKNENNIIISYFYAKLNLDFNKDIAIKYYKFVADLYDFADSDIKKELCIDAMYNYALLLEKVNIDETIKYFGSKMCPKLISAKYYKKAIEYNHIKSMYNYALLIYKSDKNEAIKYYKMVAYSYDTCKISDAQTCINSMVKYANNIEDYDEATKFYKKAISFNSLFAMHNYAKLIKNINLKEAVKYYKLMADRYDVCQNYEKELSISAMGNYAKYIQDYNRSEAIIYYEKAINFNNIHAMNNYAILISESDVITSRIYFEKIANMYNSKLSDEEKDICIKAMFNYAISISTNNKDDIFNILPDYYKEKVLKYFKKISELHNEITNIETKKICINAMCHYAFYCKNDTIAEKYYELAHSINEVYGMYFFAILIKKFHKEFANKLFKKIANLIHNSDVNYNDDELKYITDAINKYALIIYVKNKNSALKYLKLSIENGNKEASILYNSITKKAKVNY